MALKLYADSQTRRAAIHLMSKLSKEIDGMPPLVVYLAFASMLPRIAHEAGLELCSVIDDLGGRLVLGEKLRREEEP